MKYIDIKKAHHNNLKHIDVKIPLGSFTVLCGLSGSGKSSLAFDTLYVEGQRRYLKNLSNYLKQYLMQQKAPQVESITNLPPALALEQKNYVKSSRSTVASLSGILNHLRLIFEKLALAHCPTHKHPLKILSIEQMADQLLDQFKNERAFLVLEIFVKQVTSQKVFLNQLRQKGFTRFLVSKNKNPSLNDIKNIEDIKLLNKNTRFLLLDRFVIDDSQKTRLIDSLRQAFDLPQAFPFHKHVFSKQVIVQTLSGKQRLFSKKASCIECAYEFPVAITANLFNFNSPIGACSYCEGYGFISKIDEKKLIPNFKKTLKEGAIQVFENPSASPYKSKLQSYCLQKQIPINKPWCDLSAVQRSQIWLGDGKFTGIKNYFKSLESKKYKLHIRVLLSRYKSPVLCEHCKGSKLRSDLSHVQFHKKNLDHFMKMTLGQIKVFFDKEKLSSFEKEACFESFQELKKNLKYLQALGLSYLNLNRLTSSLSDGEFQRLNLSKHLGLCLSQMLYVLDEPTIGLHPRDTSRLIELLKELKALGNTVVVVEHDQDVMENCEYIIEMGPGSGKYGGKLLWQGCAKKFLNSPNSNTTQYLKRKNIILRNVRPVCKKNYKFRLLLEACTGHNLKQVDLFVPLNRFVVLTGVSGSGKSSLIVKTLYPALQQALNNQALDPLPYKRLSGVEFIKDVFLMESSGMGKSSRSSIISYIKVFDCIRNIFANTSLAKRKSFSASYFSLNVEAGRCSFCKGKAYQEIDMVFMDSLKVECEVCKGQKYKDEVLQILYQNKNIFEVLNLTVEEGFEFFRGEAKLLRAFSSLKEVGLDYLTLGQGIGSLSGGERQRLKLSRELLKSKQKQSLYILDEPTKGLHFKEIELLIKVIDRMIEAGASFLVVEHNLDFIKEADYIIDMGPEAGHQGGWILAEGSPEYIIKNAKSDTAKYLKNFINRKTKKQAKA